MSCREPSNCGAKDQNINGIGEDDPAFRRSPRRSPRIWPCRSAAPWRKNFRFRRWDETLNSAWEPSKDGFGYGCASVTCPTAR
jgi:hypothetical protein